MPSDSVRISTFDEVIGQRRAKHVLAIDIDRALAEGTGIRPFSLFGPAGLGKTSIAMAIAHRLDDCFRRVKASKDMRPEDLAQTLCDWDGVLLVDEAHMLPPWAQSMLLHVLEFGEITLRGETWDEVSESLSIGFASNQPWKIQKDLKDRVMIAIELEPYDDAEMAEIGRQMANKLDVLLEDAALVALARASAGVPRTMRRFVEQAHAYAVARGTVPAVHELLMLCDTEPDGLSRRQLQYLEALYALGGSGGVEKLAPRLHVDGAELMEMERLLLDRNLITYNGKGRELTHDGRLRSKPAPGGGRRARTEATAPR